MKGAPGFTLRHWSPVATQTAQTTDEYPVVTHQPTGDTEVGS
ncbi:MAG: hypothetical protein ACK56Q_13865 [Pirellulaceae bacterium]